MKRIFVCLLILILAGMLSLPAVAAEVSADPAEGGFTDAVGSFFTEHLTEVFSALALVGSVAVAILCKRGLFPMLTRAMTRLAGTASETEKNAALAVSTAQKTGEQMEKALASVEEETARAVSLLEHTADEAVEMQTKIDILQRGEAQMREVLLGQTEMLYGILQSAALPQYRKDALSEAYLRMKAALGALEDDGGGEG